MFHGEARFGGISDPVPVGRSAPHRPVVNLALVREFRDEYGAVSPWDGCLFHDRREDEHGKYVPFLGTGQRSTHKDEFILMVLDGASSHKSKELNIPKNVRLPPYSLELVWNILRRDYFANRVFDSLDAATSQAELGLAEMATNKPAIRNPTTYQLAVA